LFETPVFFVEKNGRKKKEVEDFLFLAAKKKTGLIVVEH